MKRALYIVLAAIALLWTSPAAAADSPVKNQDLTGIFILITIGMFAVIIAVFVWFLNKYKKNK